MSDSQHHRPIRSFARRVGRITDRQQSAIDKLWPIFGIEYSTQPLDYKTVFNNQAPLTIEIGFGMGEVLISMAKENSEQNYLGIDVHTPGVGNLLIEVDKHQLKNIRVSSYDAVEVLKHQIPNNSVDNFCIFFSDPWHKNKHHKRRLINETFVALLAKKTKHGGKIYLATDWEHYAKQMLSVFDDNKHFKNLSPDNRFCERISFRPLTKFEQRGHRLGHGVWDLSFKKI